MVWDVFPFLCLITFYVCLREWRTVCLSISLRIEVIDTKQEQFLRTVRARSKAVVSYEACSRSTLQNILELVHFRDEFMPGASRKDLAQQWSSQFQDLEEVSVAEKVDYNWVDSAVKIHDRMLKHDMCMALVMSMDSKGSCLNSIRVLELITMRGKTEDHVWILATIRDQILTKQANHKSFTSRSLPGTSVANK